MDALPEAPELPVLTPCPPGWREIEASTLGDVRGCDPWPEGGLRACDVASAHFPGEPGCTEVGPPCPAGDWSDRLPANTTTLFVRAGAGSGGLGTQAAPYGMIAEALAAATPGTVIALSKGTFDEALVMTAGVTLWGACARETVLACSTLSEDSAVVNVDVPDAALRSLRITGERSGILVSYMGSVHVEDVVIADARMVGLLVANGGAVTGSSLVVRGMRAHASDGIFGRGIDVEASDASLSRVYVEDTLEFGIFAAAGATVTIEDVAVLRTDVQVASGLLGRGVQAQQGSQLNIVRAAVEESRESGVASATEGTLITLTDAVVRGTTGAAGLGGQALFMLTGGDAEVSRALFASNTQEGVLGLDQGTSSKLSDVVVLGTRQIDDGSMGRGIDMETGAGVELARVLVDSNAEVGVFGIGAGTVIRGSDLNVRDTRGNAVSGALGRALGIEDGAGVELDRVELVRNREVSIFAGKPGSWLRLSNLHITDTAPIGDKFGRALNIQDGASLEVTHGLIERSTEAAIFALGPVTALTLNDVTVRDTVPNTAGSFGDGIVTQWVDVTVSDCRIEGSARAGTSCFASAMHVASTTFACNTIDIASESVLGEPCAFENLGGNVCTCDGSTKDCKLLSASLEPPAAFGEP
jgi:hypothetical protein